MAWLTIRFLIARIWLIQLIIEAHFEAAFLPRSMLSLPSTAFGTQEATSWLWELRRFLGDPKAILRSSKTSWETLTEGALSTCCNSLRTLRCQIKQITFAFPISSISSLTLASWSFYLNWFFKAPHSVESIKNSSQIQKFGKQGEKVPISFFYLI